MQDERNDPSSSSRVREATPPSSSANPPVEQGDVVEPPRKKALFAEALAAGSTAPVCAHGGRVPTATDRAKVGFITWSCPKASGYWLNPGGVTHAEFAQKIGEAWGRLEAKRPVLGEESDQSAGSGDPEAAPAVAVFREHHKDGGVHYHAALVLPQKSRLWHGLRDELRSLQVACYVTVPVGRSDVGLKTMLRYCAVPTITKHEVDREPYLTGNFGSAAKCWPGITDEAAKAWARLKSRPAGEEEVRRFLWGMPNLGSWADVATYVDTQLAKSPDSVEWCRLSHYLSKAGGRAGRDAITAMLERRDNVQCVEENKKTFAEFLGEAAQSPCICGPGSELAVAKAFVNTVQFHDEVENAGARALFGRFVQGLFEDKFQDREQTLCVIGVPGTGKSTAVNPFLTILPRRRVYRPSYDNKFPYSELKPHHLMISYQEFRLTDQWQPSTVLLMLERPTDVRLDRKCEKAFTIQTPPRGVMTTNYLTPSGKWKDRDVQAVMDRVTKTYWNAPLPQTARKNTTVNPLESKCKRCAAHFLCWTEPTIAQKLNVDIKILQPKGRAFEE